MSIASFAFQTIFPLWGPGLDPVDYLIAYAPGWLVGGFALLWFFVFLTNRWNPQVPGWKVLLYPLVCIAAVMSVQIGVNYELNKSAAGYITQAQAGKFLPMNIGRVRGGGEPYIVDGHMTGRTVQISLFGDVKPAKCGTMISDRDESRVENGIVDGTAFYIASVPNNASAYAIVYGPTLERECYAEYRMTREQAGLLWRESDRYFRSSSFPF